MRRGFPEILLATGFGISLSSMAATTPDPATAWEWLNLHALIDARLIWHDDTETWLNGGLGKARYGEAGHRGLEATLGEASLVAMPDLGWSWKGHVHIKADPDQDHKVDLIEAYVLYKPVPRSANSIRARTGIYYPPISLENTDLAWTSPYSITPSAINAWVGDELRHYGGDVTFEHAFDDRRSSLTAGLFGGTDKAGTQLFLRGWALHDFKPGVGDVLPAPPAVPGFDEYSRKPPDNDIFKEIDGRPGFFVSTDMKQGSGGRFTAMYYNNRANDRAVENGQAAWRTRFYSAGIEQPFGDSYVLISQALAGDTKLQAFGSSVDTDFRSAFVLLSKRFGNQRLSLRADWFDIHKGHNGPIDESENGWAALIAWSTATFRSQRLFLELLTIDSTRDARKALDSRRTAVETQVQASYRIAF